MKIDLHLHTSHGSSCAYMDPDQLVNRAKAIGLDGVCITDHDQIWQADVIQALRKKHDYLIIGGAEVNTDEGEMLVFGLHRSVLDVVKATELREWIDEAGGAMVLAHPFRHEPELVSAHLRAPGQNGAFTRLEERPVFKLVHALETDNGQSGRGEAGFTNAVAAHLDLPGTGGSDAHAILGVGSCYTLFEEEVRDEHDLVRQIKQRKIKAVNTLWTNF